jgi:hypothetical protein
VLAVSSDSWEGNAVARFCHVGVPAKKKRAGETYIAGGKVHVTDPAASPFAFEYLRFEKGSPLPRKLQKETHIAYEVEDLPAALRGQEVIVPPFDATPTLRVAFIMQDGVAVELMQNLK